MTIETQVADLQASVTALLAAINIKKADLDTAVSSAQSAATIAQSITTITNAQALADAQAAAAASASAALTSRNQAVAAAALYPAITGQGTNIPRVNAGATAMEFRTPTQFRTDLGLATTSAVTFGSLSLGTIVTKTADFTLATTENYVINNKAATACVVTLPAASGFNGRVLSFRNGVNGQVLNSASANIVQPGGTVTSAIMPAGVGQWVTLVSNGTNWVIVRSGRDNGLLDTTALASTALRVVAEGFTTPLDTELASAAWVKAYADSAVSTALTGLAVSNFAAAAVRVVADGVTTPLDSELATAAWTESYVRETNRIIDGHNRIINGQGRVNQRAYVSGTATTVANQYTLDRWRVVASGQFLTFTGDDSKRVMTAPAGGVEQIIEGANLEGGTYVLNWTGTATATVNGAARIKGETFTLPANTNATVRFANGTFTDVQLELGSTPTAFDRLHLGQELENCQRYFVRWVGDASSNGFAPIATGVVNTTTTFIAMIPLPVSMRANPVLSYTGTITVSDGSAAPNVTAITTIYKATASLVWATLSVASGLTVGRGIFLYTQNGAANAFIADAEL